MVHFLFSQLTKEMRDYQLLRISCASVFVCVSSGQKVLLVIPTVVVRGTKSVLSTLAGAHMSDCGQILPTRWQHNQTQSRRFG